MSNDKGAPAPRPRGRPPTGFDKKAYDKEYQRRRRAERKQEREK